MLFLVRLLGASMETAASLSECYVSVSTSEEIRVKTVPVLFACDNEPAAAPILVEQLHKFVILFISLSFQGDVVNANQNESETTSVKSKK